MVGLGALACFERFESGVERWGRIGLGVEFQRRLGRPRHIPRSRVKCGREGEQREAMSESRRSLMATRGTSRNVIRIMSEPNCGLVLVPSFIRTVLQNPPWRAMHR